MNFLFDQSADFRLIPHLRELGHDVQAISSNYPPGLADEDDLAIARAERRILVVADRDFGELIFHQGLVHAGAFNRLLCRSLAVTFQATAADFTLQPLQSDTNGFVACE